MKKLSKTNTFLIYSILSLVFIMAYFIGMETEKKGSKVNIIYKFVAVCLSFLMMALAMVLITKDEDKNNVVSKIRKDASYYIGYIIVTIVFICYMGLAFDLYVKYHAYMEWKEKKDAFRTPQEGSSNVQQEP